MALGVILGSIHEPSHGLFIGDITSVEMHNAFQIMIVSTESAGSCLSLWTNVSKRNAFCIAAVLFDVVGECGREVMVLQYCVWMVDKTF